LALGTEGLDTDKCMHLCFCFNVHLFYLFVVFKTTVSIELLH
jgi:hypothetical protein